MVFDRRFIAASPRYLAIRLEPQRLSDGLRPPLQDYCVLLTRSFLMVLGGRPEQLTAAVASSCYLRALTEPPRNNRLPSGSVKLLPTALFVLSLEA